MPSSQLPDAEAAGDQAATQGTRVTRRTLLGRGAAGALGGGLALTALQTWAAQAARPDRLTVVAHYEALPEVPWGSVLDLERL